ncbi:Networked 3a [Thalictrum thalictroides]|uniref:Networked 3a n=1 Tax=Thalictrum thalictroides TaxID=46969 RepID=A0A7J6URZ6_THATH|nr:Networked 3a [Thalictrum thalictroides]
MCAMENKSTTTTVSPAYSWLWGSHNSNPNQSQWLQTTLSELDEKTKAMLALIEEDGDTFAQRAEMYYKKRPELINMLEEFHKSYRSLAERHDQHLRCESSRMTHSNYYKHQVQHCYGTESYSDSNVAGNMSNFNIVYLDKATDESELSGIRDMKKEIEIGENVVHQVDKKMKGCKKMCQNNIIEENFGARTSMESKESMWCKLRLQVSMLMEDNLRQQSELIKRNDEKRKAIKDLCFQLDKLMDENRNLQQNCLKCSKVGMKQNQSDQISKFKGLFLGKFFKCNG